MINIHQLKLALSRTYFDGFKDVRAIGNLLYIPSLVYALLLKCQTLFVLRNLFIYLTVSGPVYTT